MNILKLKVRSEKMLSGVLSSSAADGYVLIIPNQETTTQYEKHNKFNYVLKIVNFELQ